ncbi:MAG: class I SAM-dependent methyltransferase [Saprospiraceae bacterium]
MRSLIYSGRIREGGVGTLTPEEYCVFYDEDLEYAYLDPKPEINYEDSSYRIAVNESNEILRYYELHTEIQTAYFELIRKYISKDNIILEIGCGGGILLDKTKEKCYKTIGIEPNTEFQKSLKQRGHIVYSNINDCLSDWKDKIDFIISFHVIEHVHHPEQFIQSIGQLLKSGGTSFVLTPNYSDILLKINFDAFAPFFFRKVHPVYLTIGSMKKMIQQHGMKFLAPVYVHEFGLSNALYWLRDKSPKGDLVMEGLDNSLDLYWKEYLIRTGQTKDIAAIFQKK